MVLYTMADILVTNDSGPGHFASMTDIDTVVLFGPETPALYGPLGDSHVLWNGLACSPCVDPFIHRISPCNDNVCMSSILRGPGVQPGVGVAGATGAPGSEGSKK